MSQVGCKGLKILHGLYKPNDTCIYIYTASVADVAVGAYGSELHAVAADIGKLFTSDSCIMVCVPALGEILTASKLPEDRESEVVYQYMVPIYIHKFPDT